MWRVSVLSFVGWLFVGWLTVTHASVRTEVPVAEQQIVPVAEQQMVPVAEQQIEPVNEALSWLDKMSHSLRELNYRGVFTYEYGAELHSLQVFHVVRNGVEKERLIHLDGKPREIVRTGHDVGCVHAGARKIRLDHGMPGNAFASAAASGFAGVDAQYQLDLAGEDRVAGRQAVIVRIKPNDIYRYGYLLYLDKDTGLLLKALTLDEKAQPMERFQYSTLEIGVEIADSQLNVSSDDAQVSEHRDPADIQEKQRDWQVVWVPAGYSASSNVSAYKGKPDGTNAGLESVVYTDGLSAFSVFLEPDVNQVAAEGMAQRGATVALTRPLELRGKAYLVTVVGEIPGMTAEKVAGSIRTK